MFSESSDLQDFQLGNFNTKNVVDMSYMFQKCVWAKNINLESFDTSIKNHRK